MKDAREVIRTAVFQSTYGDPPENLLDDAADLILSALDAAGYVVVPKYGSGKPEPTTEPSSSTKAQR